MTQANGDAIFENCSIIWLCDSRPGPRPRNLLATRSGIGTATEPGVSQTGANSGPLLGVKDEVAGRVSVFGQGGVVCCSPVEPVTISQQVRRVGTNWDIFRRVQADLGGIHLWL